MTFGFDVDTQAPHVWNSWRLLALRRLDRQQTVPLKLTNNNDQSQSSPLCSECNKQRTCGASHTVYPLGIAQKRKDAQHGDCEPRRDQALALTIDIWHTYPQASLVAKVHPITSIYIKAQLEYGGSSTVSKQGAQNKFTQNANIIQGEPVSNRFPLSLH